MPTDRSRPTALALLVLGVSIIALLLRLGARQDAPSPPYHVVSPTLPGGNVTIARAIFPDGATGNVAVIVVPTVDGGAHEAPAPSLPASFRPLRSSPRGFRGAVFVGDRAVAAFSQAEVSQVLAWSGPETEPQRLWSGPGTIATFAASANGETIAALVEGSPPRLLLFDTATSAQRTVSLRLAAGTAFGARTVFSPDGRRVAVGTTPPMLIDVVDARASRLHPSNDPFDLVSWTPRGVVVSRVTEPTLSWAGPQDMTFYLLAPTDVAMREIPSPEFVSPDARFEIRPGMRGIEVDELPTHARGRTITMPDAAARRGLYSGPVWTGDHGFVLDGDAVLRIDAETGAVESIAPGTVSCVAASRSGHYALLRERRIDGVAGIYWLELPVPHPQ